VSPGELHHFSKPFTIEPGRCRDGRGNSGTGRWNLNELSSQRKHYSQTITLGLEDLVASVGPRGGNIFRDTEMV
jgi:hypothetical protein